jgi:DNA-directed RNA polymerase subunit RPC12/RpoP
VARLDQHLERVSRGDLSKEVQVVNGDELQSLASRSNATMHEMARMRAELMEQNQALTAQARRMEDLNRTLEERVRQQSTELQAARRTLDPDRTITTTPRLSVAEAAVHPPGTYRCEACGATGRVSREVHGTIRCPRCQGTRFARVASEVV